MQFRIADTFQKALTKLTAQEQSAVKVTVFDLQSDPSNPGLKFHRISKSKDPNFWSIRASRDIRIIVHKTANSFLIAYVDHHDDAYKWAERRRIESHPKTGAMQIVEVRERVDENKRYLEPPLQSGTKYDNEAAQPKPALFARLSKEQLFGVGVPEDWLEDIFEANEDKFLVLSEHLPQEAAEALLEYAATGTLPELAKPIVDDPFSHPDAQRRFRVMEGYEELEKALEAPWEQWAVFLHPLQKNMVDADYDGPARVAGTAGTGKTVVTLHRAARILQECPDARILISTFSEPLANLLKHKFMILTGIDVTESSKVTIAPFYDVAKELFILKHGYEPRRARIEQIEAMIQEICNDAKFTEFSFNFLKYEWENVVDPWQVTTIDDYKNVLRIGRKSRLGEKQRERLWPIFSAVRNRLKRENYLTYADVFSNVAMHYSNNQDKPFTHILIDESQDLGVAELRMFAQLDSKMKNSLFFSGDLGQRIFKEPFSWLSLGVDIRGRSKSLKVNYRTSHQIKEAADQLMPAESIDVDGNQEIRLGSISVLNGDRPQVTEYNSEDDEIESVANCLSSLLKDDKNTIAAEEIAIFVRSDREMDRARRVCKSAGLPVVELSSRVEEKLGKISLGTMHYSKGLEYRVVFVMACDEDVLPNLQRIEDAADLDDLDGIYLTERHLLYVSATRAREKLFISGVEPISEFLEDISNSVN